MLSCGRCSKINCIHILVYTTKFSTIYYTNTSDERLQPRLPRKMHYNSDLIVIGHEYYSYNAYTWIKGIHRAMMATRFRSHNIISINIYRILYAWIILYVWYVKCMCDVFDALTLVIILVNYWNFEGKK